MNSYKVSVEIGYDGEYPNVAVGKVYKHKVTSSGERRYRIAYWYPDPHDNKNKRWRITSDPNDNPLSNEKYAYKLLGEINEEIEGETHNPWAWQPGGKNYWSFTKQAEVYLKYIEERAKSDEIGEIQKDKIKYFFTNFFIPYFKNTEVKKIKKHHVQIFLFDGFPEGWAPKTKKNALTQLRAFLSWLYDGEVISRIPKFPAIKVPKPTIKTTTQENQEKIVNAAPERHQPILHFQTRQFLRPGEVRALKVGDVHTDEDYIEVNRAFSDNALHDYTKTRRGYRIPIHPDLKPTIKRLMKDKHPEAWLFTDPDTGDFYKRKKLYDVWTRAAKKVGIKISNYTGTRHSAATQIANQGVPLQVLKAALNHTSMETTERYFRMNTSSMKELLWPDREKVVPLNKKKASGSVPRVSPGHDGES